MTATHAQATHSQHSNPGILPDQMPNIELAENVSPSAWINPTPARKYDLVIIGAGTGGLVTAAIGAALGARVALVERHAMGGDCLNVGCVPSKGMLRAARAWAEARTAQNYFGGPSVFGNGDFDFAMMRMRRIRAAISTIDSAVRYRDMGVDVFFGEGRFIAGDQIEVGAATLSFRRAVIATGSRPAVPNIDGLARVPFHTNETIFDLHERPQRLIVIGGGAIACELSQAFRRLGSDVTLIERAERVLGKDDGDAAAVVASALERDGVRLRCGTQTKRVSMAGAEVDVELAGGEHVIGDAILVATGRGPNIEGIGLDRADIAFDEHGVVNDVHLRTTNHRVYVVGDVAGRDLFTHVADAHARIVVRNALFFGRGRVDQLVIPWCTYTEPELAHVGPPVDRLARMTDVRTITVPMCEVDRARLDGDDSGFLRLHASKRGHILAATVVAARAGDIISTITAAMTNRTKLSDLGKTIFPYPTESEAIRRAADATRRGALTPGRRIWIERVLTMLRDLSA